MAKDIIGINPNLAGVIIVFPAGIGALLAIILIPKYLKRLRKKELIEKSLILVSLTLWLVIFLVPELNHSLRALATAILFIFSGAAFVGIIIPSQTYLQEKTPRTLLGRVFGNFWFIATIATIFPVLFGATVSEVFGVRMLFFLIGLATLVAYVYSIKKGQSILERSEVGGKI